MTVRNISIPLNTGDIVSAVLHTPKNPARSGVVIAHGAANDMNTPLIKSLAEGLAQKGLTCLRFNFLYRERQKKSLDPEHRLVHAWQQAMACMRVAIGSGPVIAAGKSLGARIAAQATAQGDITPEGLIFLGYPLHAPGRKDKLRDAPLYAIQQPMLFFEGTRDPFCDLSLMDKVLKKVAAPTRLEIIDNGDHSLGLPKSDPIQPDKIYARIVNDGMNWISQLTHHR